MSNKNDHQKTAFNNAYKEPIGVKKVKFACILKELTLNNYNKIKEIEAGNGYIYTYWEGKKKVRRKKVAKDKD